ncbi:CU044_5270 family protein [Actinomadura sp. WMMA1423]|uniref:CU044_5270 family protein n=1 Tax=Actinomadura sp. WMMA1423 TaxID=2591108 RepID=UPI0011479889|nr:CU044_5270 family protein [Actinomadura sp. WMMA1423]
MTTDEITLFREGRPDVPEYDRMAKARLRVRLSDDAPASPARPWRARRRLLTAGALTGAMAVAAVVAIGQDDRESEPVALRPVGSPQDLARNAALVAATKPVPKLGPAQWAYVKTVYAETQEGGGRPLFGTPAKTRTQELWRRTDGERFAVLENGKLRVAEGSKYTPSYPELLSLPADPGAVLARIYKTVDAEYARRLAEWSKPIPEGLPKRTREKYALMKKAKPRPPTAEERDSAAFEFVTRSMRDAVLPSKIEAALYGAAARIPGVRYEPTAADLGGRRGVTLYRVENGYLRSEIFIDPKTYAYLGFRAMVVKDHREPGLLPVKRGQITGWGALTASAFVPKPGGRG